MDNKKIRDKRPWERVKKVVSLMPWFPNGKHQQEQYWHRSLMCVFSWENVTIIIVIIIYSQLKSMWSALHAAYAVCLLQNTTQTHKLTRTSWCDVQDMTDRGRDFLPDPQDFASRACDHRVGVHDDVDESFDMRTGREVCTSRVRSAVMLDETHVSWRRQNKKVLKKQECANKHYLLTQFFLSLSLGDNRVCLV